MTDAWTKAKYPGDSVRETRLRRGDEYGDVRIQHYDHNVRVGAFLPGVESCSPGDTPKVFPEMDSWFPIPHRIDRANDVFDLYLQAALDQGWEIAK